MGETMLVTQALDERDLLVKKITDKIEKASFVAWIPMMEMLILKGFTGGMLDSFLHGFRKMKIQPVALKAVLTEANCGWNSLELHDELVKEHESMHSQTPSKVTDNKETE